MKRPTLRRRRDQAARLRRPARQPTPEEIAAVTVEEPEGGWQFGFEDRGL